MKHAPVPTTLSRAVRIFVCRPADAVASAISPAVSHADLSRNSFAGFPSTNGIGAWFEIEVAVRGTPELQTGYLATLAQLDRSVRDSVIPLLQNALFSTPDGLNPAPATLLVEMVELVSKKIEKPIESLKWSLSPYHQLTWSRKMPQQTTFSSIFEFAASHRLNDPSRTPAENAEFFGKCNKLNGHGHNYRIEVGVAIPVGSAFGMADLEGIVDRAVIERFDHMNLNIDCPEFHSLNPSVEHIAAVCFDLLKGALSDCPVELKRVRLWETSKTSATIEA